MRSAPAIDLAAARAARDITVSLGRASATPSLDFIAGRVRHWADRAQAARDRLTVSDPEAANAAVAWCSRRLRGDVRRCLGAKVHEAVRADAVGAALWAFEAELTAVPCNGGAE